MVTDIYDMEPVVCPLVLYTPARLFFYCDRISRLHWDCTRIEDCSRIVWKGFERDLDGFLQCCNGRKGVTDTACLELMYFEIV